MDLKTYLESEPRGTAPELARAISGHAPDIYMWADGKRPIPVHRAVQIERATGGKVTRQEMRPNDYWEIWTDLEKPETGGKRGSV